MRIRNKITAFCVSLLLMLNVFIMAVPISAESGASKTYVHDGYTVKYTVASEWTGNQNIQITITNTGSEAISNWALGFNAQGEINGIWNAKIYAEQAPNYIITGAGYNSDIAQGASASFGYSLKGQDFELPLSIVNCSERTEITDGYSVYYNITDDSGDTYQADMIIENNSDTDISFWQLSFDGNVNIGNLWNGKLTTNSDGSFMVKNTENNAVISAGKSVKFSFSGLKSLAAEETTVSDITEETSSTDVTEETIVSDITEETSSTDVTEETTVSDITEETSATDVTEETTVSDITEETSSTNVTEETTVSDIVVDVTETDVTEESYAVKFIIPEAFSMLGAVRETPELSKYSEIIFENYKLTCVTISTDFNFDNEEIDPELDSDNDGLPDYIEREIGTKRYNPDTDSDGLPDGYEYFTLGTDPLKSDSDNNGISDANEDFDDDGLSSLEEYDLETNPFCEDTDYDGLTDYDEVNVYNTDPLVYDSDSDKVSDGDEVILALDPLNPETYGYPDSEYTTKQTVAEDSEALAYINNIDGNPYTISVSITAAGVAENCLSGGESGYSSSILQNEAVLGIAPELTYSEGLTVTDVILSFNLSESAVNDRLGIYSDDPAFDGINRFNIFKYFEDTNVLLPIQTTCNTAENSVSAHVDEVGTYCVIDMEKWVNNIENMPKDGYYDNNNEPANIVFCLDTRNIIDNETFGSTKNDIKAITEDSFGRYSDIKVYIYYQQFESNFQITNKLLTDSKTGKDYFTDYEQAVKAVDTLKTYPVNSSFWTYDYVEASNFMIDTCDENIIAMYHFTADDRVMGSIDEAKKLMQSVQNSKYTTKDNEEINRIHISLLTSSDSAIDENSYAYELAELSGGIVYSGENNPTPAPLVMTRDLNENTAEVTQTSKTGDNLTEILGEGGLGKYIVITSTGLIDSVKLNSQLNKSGSTDTDIDGLSDWDEVNTEILSKHLAKDLTVINNTDLPLFSDLILHSSEWESFKPYLWTAEDFRKYAYMNCFDNVRILPINSDPSMVDSDGDGILDCVNNELEHKTEFADPNPLKFEYLWEWPVVSADAVEEVNGNLQSKIDVDGNKLVFKDEYKLTRLQTSPYEDRGGSAHNGIDISTGASMINYYNIAAYSGIVHCIKENSKSAGNYVVLEHNINGVKCFSRYLHMESISSALYDGKEVKAGDVLGITGNTGYSFGRHLHFDIPINYDAQLGKYSKYVDPILFNYIQLFKDKYPNLKYNFFALPYEMRINIPIKIENTDNSSQSGDAINGNINKSYFECILYSYKLRGVLL